MLYENKAAKRRFVSCNIDKMGWVLIFLYVL